MDGVLVIDKPAGITSHDVVFRVRRALGESRIGHTGTLDPMATGVLPLVIGRATRLASMLSGADKTYVAGIRLGSATDTYDRMGLLPDGRPAADAALEPPAVHRAAIEAALGAFRGTFAQRPPPYSAKKIGGVAAYTLARKNTPVAPAAVDVTVRVLTLLDHAAGLVTVQVTASAGFYVRSLAHDLGAALGCGAHIESLRRTRAGVFGIEAAVPLEVVQAERGEAAARLLPLEALLTEVPAVRLNERGARRAGHGNTLGPEDFDPGPAAPAPRIRLLGPSGTLVGLAEPRPGGLLQPVVVLV